jgi:hypothetical protein
MAAARRLFFPLGLDLRMSLQALKSHLHGGPPSLLTVVLRNSKKRTGQKADRRLGHEATHCAMQ